MSTDWSQKNVTYKTIPSFVDQACALKPALIHKTIVPVAAAIDSQPVSLGMFYSHGFSRNTAGVLDFGNHAVGYLTLYVDALDGPYDAPAFIKLKFCEHRRELGENSAEYDGWIGKGWLQEEWLHIDDFPAVIRLPRRYAMRYLLLEVLDTSPNYRLCVTKVEFDTVTSASDQNLPDLKITDPLLSKIDAVSLQTMRGCMQEVFEDGPKRDRRLWLGDLRLQALVNATTFRNFDLVKRCLYLFAGMVRDDGAVASCLYAEPRLLPGDIFLLDYSLFFIPTLLDYFSETHDQQTLLELSPSALRQLDLAQAHILPTGIIAPEGNYYCFIDWNEALDKQTAMNGVWLYSLQQGMQLCKLLHDDETGQRLEQAYVKGKAAIWAQLWDADRRMFVSGPDRQISWASQIWMCLAGVISGPEAAQLLRRATDTTEIVSMTTPYMFHHYIQALIDCGEADKAAQEVRRYWGGMIEAGADTFWELYDPKDLHTSPYGSNMINSCCHAWSCTPAYFLRKQLI